MHNLKCSKQKAKNIHANWLLKDTSPSLAAIVIVRNCIAVS